jgi:hypothetical protein
MMDFGKEFDSLPTSLAERTVRVAPSTPVEIMDLYQPFSQALHARHASVETILALRWHNPSNCWSIFPRLGDHATGLFLMLMLNSAGHSAILAGGIDGTSPDPALCAASDDPVDAIYIWGLYAPHAAVLAVPLIARELQHARFRSADLFGRAVTPAGRRLMVSVGFRPLLPEAPDIYQYRRQVSRNASPPNESRRNVV